PELDAGIDEPARRSDAACRLHSAGRAPAGKSQRDRQGLAAVGRSAGQAAGGGSTRDDARAARDRERALGWRRLRPALRAARKADRLLASRAADRAAKDAPRHSLGAPGGGGNRTAGMSAPSEHLGEARTLAAVAANLKLV